MPTPPKGRSDYLALGEWNVVCFECGMKFKSSVMRRHWQGYYVCPEHWESRHPQDFVKGIPDIVTPPWTQPRPADNFIYFCTPNDTNDIPGLAVPGCAIPGYISPAFDLTLLGVVCQPLLVEFPFYVNLASDYLVCNTLFLDDEVVIDGILRIKES